MDKQLKDWTIEELKIAAYDQLATLEMAQKNLQILNQEISGRINKPNQTKTMEEETKDQVTPEVTPEAVEATDGTGVAPETPTEGSVETPA